MNHHIKLWTPEPGSQVSSISSLQHFFDEWYIPTLAKDLRRRPIGRATIDRRRAAINWWTRLMRSPGRPEGPPLAEITNELIAEFRKKLESATFRRGKWTPNSYPLSPVSQTRTVQEIQIVVGTAGPATGRLVRAGLLPESPGIYMPSPDMSPKPTWNTNEARLIVAGLATSKAPRLWKHGAEMYHKLSRATLAFWFYTGHRATTINQICWNNLRQDDEGNWRLHIVSVKTGKMDIIAIHARLLEAIRACEGMDGKRIIPWPVYYSAVVKAHVRWQHLLPANRKLSPQAWRRCHARHIQLTGFSLARDLAARSLCHASASTTDAHYTSARDAAVLMLPDIFQ